MKILQINAYCGYGSTGRIVMDIVNAISKENKENKSYVIYGFFRNEYQNAIKILPGDGLFTVKSKILLPRITGISGYSRRFATKRALKVIDEIKPDIIHLHNIHGEYIHCGILFDYLKKKKIPVVWTLHDCWSFTGRCSYFDYVRCEKWKTGCYSCDNRNTYPITYFFDFSAQLWKRKKSTFQGVQNLTIVTPSYWLASLVDESFLRDYNTVVIHNGVDTSVFRKKESNDLVQKYNLESKKIILGVANAWSPRKGLKYFIELSEKLPDQYQIVLIGLNDTQLNSMPNNIIGMKRTDSIEELASWYSVAYAYVNPTLEDNYPTTNIEAQSCETPVITFATGGSPESVQYGIVVKEKSSDALLRAIIELEDIEKPMMRTDVYSREYCANQYLKLYESILRLSEGSSKYEI